MGHENYSSTFSPGWLIHPGVKGDLSRLLDTPGTKAAPLVPGTKLGLKEGTFSPGFMLPVGKLELKEFSNQKYSLFLYSTIGWYPAARASRIRACPPREMHGATVLAS